jgi:hypothetical protein
MGKSYNPGSHSTLIFKYSYKGGKMDDLRMFKNILKSGSAISSSIERDSNIDLVVWAVGMAEHIMQLKNYNDEEKRFSLIQLLLLTGAVSRLVGEKSRVGNWESTLKADLISTIVRYLPLELDVDKFPWVTRDINRPQNEDLKLVLAAIKFKY